MIIDVSKWQGSIDWTVVKKNHPEIEGVFLKATEGVGYIDPQLSANFEKAGMAGFKIGYYHFASLNNTDAHNDAISEAKYFYSIVRLFPRTMPLVLDIESNPSKLPKEKVLEWIKTFFSELEKLGETNVVLYSYAPFLNENLPANHGLGNIRLWLAAYTATPKLPYGWAKYWLWQYSSKGVIKGIKGKVDLNKY